MRIPDEWLDALFFLGMTVTADGESKVRYGGTGFVLSAANEFDSALRRLYLVTARHNVEAAPPAANLSIRVNTRTGGSVVVGTDPWGPWLFHADDTVDIAIAPPSVLSEVEFHFAFAQEQIMTPMDAQAFNFGIGHELIAMGLFRERGGEVKNIPVIRTGIVSAMPGEPIEDGTGYGPYRAYLAEILSMGGLSGSPVFFHPTSGTEFPRVSFYLVGLIRSHWDEMPPYPPPGLLRREWVNQGIATLTPADGILEMLESEALKAACEPRGHRQAYRRDDDPDRTAGPERARHERLPGRGERLRRRHGDPPSAAGRLPRRMDYSLLPRLTLPHN